MYAAPSVVLARHRVTRRPQAGRQPLSTVADDQAQAEYEIVLTDPPPATEYADAQTVAYRAGDALLVSRQDQTRVADTERAVREITDASARIVGTLMNAY